MYPSPFTYCQPATVSEAETLFSQYESPAYLSGGHTLIPAMKNRLAAPDALLDLRRIPELHGIRLQDGQLEIGAATTHAEVAASADVVSAIPTLARLAGSIGDPQVRSMGTIGGSVANNDPSADYPAAVLGLEAAIVTNTRRIPADEFFTGLFSSALEPGEIILRIVVPVPHSCGYAKLCSLASRYAVAGVFVARTGGVVRVAVTGAGNDGVFRWREAEIALGARFAPSTLDGLLPDRNDLIEDGNGDGTYRAHLVRQLARQAIDHFGTVWVR